jgi:lysozyme family protein
MADFSALVRENARRWSQMKIIRGAEMDRVAPRLVASGAKSRYKEIEVATGVPWPVIAVIHEREASQNFLANLAQGDPFDKVSTHVPNRRGPFPSFKAAAIDALTSCAPYAANWTDWSVGGALTLLEQYNGIGYWRRGLPSPYVWAGTDQYVSGKYVADGVFDPSIVDNQLGCAGLLRAMMKIDRTITLAGRSFSVPQVKPPPEPVPASPLRPHPQPSIWAAVFSSILAIFKGKQP